MAEQFRIDVIVDPTKAKPGSRAAERMLERLERQGEQINQTLTRALGPKRGAGIERQLHGVQAILLRTERQARETNERLFNLGSRVDVSGLRRAETQLDRLARRGDGLRRLFAGLFGGLSLALVIRETARANDLFLNMQNRLRLVTDGADDLQETMGGLFDVARDTRTSFQGTAEIFNRLALSASDLGTTNQELERFTKSLNQAIILSGASAIESRASLIQLSQGMALGVLRGDELRSVMEQLPVVADVIADHLGVTRAEIRALGLQGKITADLILESFAAAEGDLAQRFETTVPTISQSFTALQTSLIETIGELDEATGASGVLSSGILAMSDNVEVATVGVLGLSGALLGAAGTAFPAATAAAGRFIVAAGPLLAVTAAAGAVTFAVKAFTNEFEEAAKTLRQVEQDAAFIPEIGSQITSRQRELANLNRQIQEQARRGVEASESQRAAVARLEASLRSARGEVREEVAAQRAAEAARLRNAEAIREVRAELEQEARLIKLTSEERKVQEDLLKITEGLQKRGVDLSDARLESTRQEIEALVRSNEEAERQDRILNQILGPIREYERNLASLQALLIAGKLNQQQFNDAVEAFKPQELREGPDPFGEQLASLNKINVELQAQAGNQDVNLQLLRIQTQLWRDGVDLTDEQVKRTRQLLEENQALSEEIGRNARLDQLREQVDTTGQLVDLERDLLAIRGTVPDAALDEALLDVRQRLLDASGDFGSGIESAFIDLKREAQDFAAVGREVVGTFADTATDALTEFAITGKFRFKDFASSVVEDLIRITARLLIVQSLSALFPGAGAVGGSLFGGGLNAGRQHGGTVQPGQRPFLVGEGPPGENRAELFVPNRTGTIVPNPATVGGSSSSQPVNLTLVNVTDPNQVDAAIASEDSDEVIINVAERHPARMRAALGL